MKKLLLIPLLLIIISSLYAYKTIPFSGEEYAYIRDVANYYHMSYSQNSNFAYLKGNAISMKFEFPKRSAEINGVVVNLTMPVDYNNGNPIISKKDILLTLDPILNNGSLIKQKVKTILIDPGHGGEDQGTHGRFLKEKNLTLDIAKRLKTILEATGYKVYMTRYKDSTTDLNSRPDMIKRYNADIYVSIHANSAKPDISGIETFALAPYGTASTYSKKTVDVKEKGNAYDKDNIRLAYEVQKSADRIGVVDRGVKRSRFAVLRGATKPAILIETGFLSNAKEEKLLSTPQYQDKVARSIANGINAYAKAVGS